MPPHKREPSWPSLTCGGPCQGCRFSGNVVPLTLLSHNVGEKVDSRPVPPSVRSVHVPPVSAWVFAGSSRCDETGVSVLSPCEREWTWARGPVTAGRPVQGGRAAGAGGPPTALTGTSGAGGDGLRVSQPCPARAELALTGVSPEQCLGAVLRSLVTFV